MPLYKWNAWVAVAGLENVSQAFCLCLVQVAMVGLDTWIIVYSNGAKSVHLDAFVDGESLWERLRKASTSLEDFHKQSFSST